MKDSRNSGTLRGIARSLAFGIATVIIALLGTHCASQPQVVVDRGDLITTRDIDIQDWQKASRRLLNELFKDANLTGGKNRKATILLGDLKNETFLQLDTDLLKQKMKMVIAEREDTSVFAGTDRAAKKWINLIAQLKDSQWIDPSTLPKKGKAAAPNYVLKGEIKQHESRSTGGCGGMYQVAYIFHADLIDVQQLGNSWSHEVMIIKQQ